MIFDTPAFVYVRLLLLFLHFLTYDDTGRLDCMAVKQRKTARRKRRPYKGEMGTVT